MRDPAWSGAAAQSFRATSTWGLGARTRAADGSGDGLQGVVAELAQRVMRAAQQLAGDGEDGAVLAEALLELQVVGVVGRAGLAGRFGGLEGGPAQRGRSLAGEMAGAALLVSLVHGDVQAGEAHGLTRGGEAPRVAELGEDRARDPRADPVVAHQRAAARLPAGERLEIAIERSELRVDVLDHRQRPRSAGGRRA